METREIGCALQVEKSTAKSFGGVYPIDKIPPREKLKYDQAGQSFVVVNLDPSYKTGSHWVVVCVNLGGHCEYFDSYGQKPPEPIENYLGKSYLCSRAQLQSIFSTTCGQWCVMYIWSRCNGASIVQFVKEFRTKSDIDVNKLFNKHFVTKRVQVVFSQTFWTSQLAKSFNEGAVRRKLQTNWS